jgi:predicted nucleic acid-binding protein
MLFAIDTSSLIVLQKRQWLNLCECGENQFIWPVRVTEELKRQKGKNKKILNLLASETARESQVQKTLEIAKISRADAEVISLAAENNAVVVSEDILLRQKATRLGLSAVSVAGLVILFYQYGLYSKDECRTRLKTLHDEKFLSKTEYRQLLQSILP